MSRKAASRGRAGTYWIYGPHAVRAALSNPRRRITRLLLSERTAKDFLPRNRGPEPEISPARQISAVLEPGAAHGGAAAEVFPLEGGTNALTKILGNPKCDLLLLLDQVTDPRNVGAILRSASVFGANAVLAPSRGAPQESGALAKAASGALERIPYLRIGNLAEAISLLDRYDWVVIGLDSSAPQEIAIVASEHAERTTALVLGAEGRGLRRLTRERCHYLARIPTLADTPSLNVSAAAAIALYALAGFKG